MKTLAVVLNKPEHLTLDRLDLSPAGEEDVVVDIEWSGISTGTERLLWAGRMPHFPGMGYPLVPGYESVGRVRAAGPRSGRQVGEFVFVPGARCFGEVRGLFGGAASRVDTACSADYWPGSRCRRAASRRWCGSAIRNAHRAQPDTGCWIHPTIRAATIARSAT
jgi:2-desacetyl-2-hydroxyethyl bacteriochlorophyllide A dehydrogenase